MRDALSRRRGGRRTLRLWSLLTGLLLVPLVIAPADLPRWNLCPFRAATGVPCPACGLTHALLASGRCDWSAGFRYHPLGPPVWTAAAGFWLACGLSLITGRPSPVVRPAHAAIAGLLFLFVWVVGLMFRVR